MNTFTGLPSTVIHWKHHQPRVACCILPSLLNHLLLSRPNHQPRRPQRETRPSSTNHRPASFCCLPGLVRRCRALRQPPQFLLLLLACYVQNGPSKNPPSAISLPACYYLYCTRPEWSRYDADGRVHAAVLAEDRHTRLYYTDC